MKKTILTAIAVAASAAQAVVLNSRRDLNAGTGADLDNNTIYDVREDCEILGAAGKAALRVPADGTVAINVKPGVTLTVRGGDGNGASGAGPGILVPADSTLYLLGEGTIVAKGGNAAAGGNGGNGGTARVEDETSSAGAGGNGGAGGGGAAPGIGTMGGNGGAEKLGPTIAVRDTSWDTFPQNGNDGYAGNAGATSAAMGKVVILGSLVVRTTGGTAGSGGGAGSTDGGTDENWGARWYTAGGGGGGGGGAGGGAPSYGIGAGGGGGGSGGTGGTGGFQDTTVGKTGKRHPNGGGGAGGTGGSAGGSGGTSNPDRPVDSPSFSSSRHGGGGGTGGAAGGRGGDGTLVIGPSVQFVSSPRRASNTSLSQADSSLYDTEISFYSEGQKVGTASASLMRTMPGAADVSRNGYRFLGYFTEEEGGTCVYGPDGSASSPVWESADESVRLYAHWEIAPTMLVVNTNEEGEKLGGGKVTLRDAVRALYDNPDLCGTGGVRRIEFSLPAEDNVITLTNTIVVTGGTVPFEIDGVNGGNGVTIAAQGGGFSLLQLSGVDITLESINFRNCQERAVVHSGGFLTIDDCSFIGNKGALQCGEKSVLVVLNSTFADNEAESTGGAVVMSTDSVFATFVNSTFSRNKANLGSAVASSTDLVFIHCTLVPGDANTLVSADGFEVGFLNTLVAKPSGAVAVEAAETTSICSSVGTQDESDILNTVQADDFLGIRQIWYEPVQSSASGNRDAARIYYDHGLENIAISTNGVKVAVYGNPDRATMLLGIDQLHTARMAPVRGSIRLATGSQPPVVNLEGVAWGMTNASVTATAIVTYDDETVSEVPMALRTNADAVFGASVEVDGSDLYTHNATVVSVPELPGEPKVTVATSPYALVASSASAIATDDSEVYLEGGEIGVTTMQADSLVVSRLSVGGDSFSAGSLAGFKDITLDDVNMRGGALRLLGSKSKDGGSQMANLANKTVGGGDDEDSGSVTDGSKTWTARYDGFVQVRVEAKDASTCRVGLTVGSVTVTPVAAIGTSGKRTPIWTVPVRKDETVTLTASGSTVGYKTQFVYFGVKE